MINTCIKYLETTASKLPNKTAIDDGANTITFAELEVKAQAISGTISSEVKNSPIAVFLPKNLECIVGFAGVLYSENFYVPIDIKSPKARIEKILDSLEPRYIITNTKLKTLLEKFGLKSNIVMVNIDEVKAIKNFHFSNSTIDTDPIYCIFTSGSTGIPKGVVVPHRGVIDYIDWATETYDITEKDTIGNQAPFHFDNSTLDIYLMLKTGATLVIIPEFNFAFPAKLIEFLNHKKINHIFWVPSVMNNILKIDLFSDIKPKYLKKILFAGEVMPVKTLNYWQKHLPNALFSNLYGPTEITVDCTYFIVDRKFEDSDSLPIGIPCINTNILILNDINELVKEDEIGELCVRGSSLALGYWNNPEKTKSAFVQNPLHNNYPEKIYRTGDLVKYNYKGEILFIGRKDSQIKHMGYRIELGEIENTIIHIDGVDSACLLYDQNKQEIILFYEAQNESVDELFIRRNAVILLPKYMMPSKIIKLDSLPMNSNKKIDRIFLKKKYID